MVKRKPVTKTEIAIRTAYEKGYRATESGEIIGMRGRPLKLQKNGRYPMIAAHVGDLTGSGTVKFRAHRFIAYCKFGDRIFNEGIVVRHLDDDPNNLAWDNIEIGTASDNYHDIDPEMRAEMLRRASEAKSKLRPNRALLTDEQVREIRTRRRNGERAIALAEEYGIVKATVHRIINRETYKWVE